MLHYTYHHDTITDTITAQDKRRRAEKKDTLGKPLTTMSKGTVCVSVRRWQIPRSRVVFLEAVWYHYS